jgi:flagellar biosynthesis protein FliP
MKPVEMEKLESAMTKTTVTSTAQHPPEKQKPLTLDELLARREGKNAATKRKRDTHTEASLQQMLCQRQFMVCMNRFTLFMLVTAWFAFGIIVINTTANSISLQTSPCSNSLMRQATIGLMVAASILVLWRMGDTCCEHTFTRKLCEHKFTRNIYVLICASVLAMWVFQLYEVFIVDYCDGDTELKGLRGFGMASVILFLACVVIDRVVARRGLLCGVCCGSRQYGSDSGNTTNDLGFCTLRWPKEEDYIRECPA